MTRTITIDIYGKPADSLVENTSKQKKVILLEYHGRIRTTRPDIDAKFQEVKALYDKKFPADLYPLRQFNVT